jgi:endonuclease/exonuclease/phosphatase family metal-dependent hydrolase
MTSAALRRDVDFRESHIIDDNLWSKASDHRPMLAVFR